MRAWNYSENKVGELHTHTFPATYSSTRLDENSYSNYLTLQLYITSTKKNYNINFKIRSL